MTAAEYLQARGWAFDLIGGWFDSLAGTTVRDVREALIIQRARDAAEE